MTKSSASAVKKPSVFHNLLSGALIAIGGFMLAAGFLVLKWIGVTGLGVTGFWVCVVGSLVGLLSAFFSR